MMHRVIGEHVENKGRTMGPGSGNVTHGHRYAADNGTRERKIDTHIHVGPRGGDFSGFPRELVVTVLAASDRSALLVVYKKLLHRHQPKSISVTLARWTDATVLPKSPRSRKYIATPRAFRSVRAGIRSTKPNGVFVRSLETRYIEGSELFCATAKSIGNRDGKIGTIRVGRSSEIL